ncbi:hypothetical protein ZOSMA_230G00180 [Zostera marina]|uniref:Uncharacterized protein n=1 Tax=Zostera marina TaxID=29655 RepID=A0A0K9PKE8_ZOSMR|nr:hypothetical protein ZOSMA_230G00180 [Zostera marina]
MSSPEYIEKYNKYQADYIRRLKAKYFSKRSFNGANVFDEQITIENEVIKASRFPCTKSFTDSIQSLDGLRIFPSSSAAETSSTQSKKNMRKLA